MNKSRFAAKLVAGLAVAAVVALGSATATTAQARDTGWGPMGVTVQAGHSVSPSMDTGWGPM